MGAKFVPGRGTSEDRGPEVGSVYYIPNQADDNSTQTQCFLHVPHCSEGFISIISFSLPYFPSPDL